VNTLIYLIGDVHGKINEYYQIIRNLNNTIQLGDFGVGFVEFPELSRNHRFIRGNHDNPEICQMIPNFLGDYGILLEHDIFFISGAYSIDKNLRTIGIDWWENEELTNQQIEKLINYYELIKPNIVISHDAPGNFLEYHFNSNFNNKTNSFMEALFDIYEPDVWVFAHHHESIREKFGETQFVGLDELEVYKLET
jgi:predicted phosphodiesterase